MTKALIYNPYWDTLGGGERYTASVVRLLLDLGWQVDITWSREISSEINSRFGIDISAANFIPAPPNYSLLSLRYSLVFWVSDGSLPVSLARKTIVHFQFPFTGVAGQSLPNRLKSAGQTFVCNSRFTKGFIDREYSVVSNVVYPPVATASFPPGLKTPTILYVGRFSHLTQAKNPHLLIEAFSRLHPQLPDWKLVLAGGSGVGTTDSQLPQLRRLAQGMPVEIVTNPTLSQLQRLYATASLFWSASGLNVDPNTDPLKVEHFGITPVEAMAAGCVPLLSAVGGHTEIITPHEDGYLYSDLSQLIALTLELAAHPRRLHALSQTAIKKSKLFDTTVFTKAFTSLL